MASSNDNEKIGMHRVTVVVIISVIPYSAVDNVLVYKGTRKNVINFEPILPIRNSMEM